ncbi:MAG: Tat pathway signal protein [Desulfobacteraceae bacterium]|nr:MAG: Tat pathway signal protein [Desulfobacteraceae bacterium]
MKRLHHLLIPLVCLIIIATAHASPSISFESWKISPEQLTVLEDLQRDTFKFFWETTNPKNGLTPDRYPNMEYSSVAGVGFALTAYLIGVEKQYVTRQEAAERTLTTLRFLWEAPQSDDQRNAAGYKGFFYHFLDMDSGRRHHRSELSTIDTALLIAGVLSALTYFDADNEMEARIRTLADALYRRIEWPWAYSKKHQPLLSMGWRPEKGHIDAYWRGYNEAMILYILALGSPTHPIDPAAWEKWTSTYHWDTHFNYPHVNFGPLFGHQYSHVWIDFREIQDAYMRSKGIDYFVNSQRATYAAQAYCIANPSAWKGYNERVWGLTACNGPAGTTIYNGDKQLSFYRYWARGTSAGYLRDDGTISPTAVGGSIPFAPAITIGTLEHFRTEFGDRLYGEYGFKDAFNLSFPDHPEGWFDNHYLAIDQGPILLMIENYRSEFIWNLMKKNPYIKEGLARAGFDGGWLSPEQG